MKLVVRVDSFYICAVVKHGEREAVLRSWPWPRDMRGRQKHFAQALVYTDKVREVLGCAVEVLGKPPTGDEDGGT